MRYSKDQGWKRCGSQGKGEIGCIACVGCTVSEVRIITSFYKSSERSKNFPWSHSQRVKELGFEK